MLLDKKKIQLLFLVLVRLGPINNINRHNIWFNNVLLNVEININ